jgi:predicted TIM-barrel fold metal-dependent hydrolase
MTQELSQHPVIAIEEHYWDAELATHFEGAESSQVGVIESRLRSFGDDRIRDMNSAGIDKAVLSHGAPSGQRLAADVAVPLISRVNDRLHAAVLANPSRFAAFAALPTAAPHAAADELERCVGMGFKGAMIHGLTNGEFIDLPKFWPIFARAEALDVPIYLHPSLPHPDVVAAYYADYMPDHPLFARPAWGFTVECGTQAIRLMLSGVFERHPDLKIVLGHLGESLPFQLWRIDNALSRPGGTAIGLREIFTRNFWVTTSGFFSTPALVCTLQEIGVEHVMFAVDWPFVPDSAPAAAWLNTAPLSDDDKCAVLGGNARRLLRI